MNLKALQEELLQHAKVGRGGVGDETFRALIALDQMGSYVRHITHDTKLNPVTRPHGSPASEINDAGHMLRVAAEWGYGRADKVKHQIKIVEKMCRDIQRDLGEDEKEYIGVIDVILWRACNLGWL